MKKILFLISVIFVVFSCNTREDNPLISDETTTVVEGDATVDVQIKTVAYNGHYSPRNIGAIWIEDSDGNFVKTLRVWADKERNHLVGWISATNKNTIDAVTSATKSTHDLREAIWNLKDASDNLVDNGNYKLRAEFTEDNSSGSGPDGKLLSVDFQLTDSTQVLNFDDQTYFKNIQININR